VAVLLTLAACASAPPARPAVPSQSWLGGQPRVVARIDATQVTAWNAVTRGPELRAVGDRTRVIWLGLDLESLDDVKKAASTMHVVLEGDFPKGAAGLVLDWNSSWKKNASQVWTNAKYGLSVSLPRDNLVTVRRDDSPVTPSEGVLRDLDPAVLAQSAAWISMWDPGQMLFGPVGSKLFPVQRLDVVLHQQGLYLQGPVILYFADERAARAASVVLKLVAAAIRSRLGQDLTWTVDGSRITGETLRIKQDDITGLAQTLIAPEAP
jgi:hypothetical protein